MTTPKLERSRSFDDLRAAHQSERAPGRLRRTLWERFERLELPAIDAAAPGSRRSLLPSSSLGAFAAVATLGALLIWLVSLVRTDAPEDLARSDAEGALAAPSLDQTPNAVAGSPSGRPCPSAEIPPGTWLEVPYRDPDGALSLHTFDAATPSCGPLRRRYLQLVPDSLRPRTSAPILIALHDRGKDADWLRVQETRWYFDALAKRKGFVLVYANAAPSAATDPRWGYSGAWQTSKGAHPEIDDAAYLEEVVRDLARRGVISGNNDVLLVGFGEGGTMALAAAAERPERYAGVAAFVPAGVDVIPAPAAPVTRVSRVLIVTRDPEENIWRGTRLQAAARQWAVTMGGLGEARRARSEPVLVASGVKQLDVSGGLENGRDVRIVVLDPARDLFLPPGAADPLSLAASRRRPDFVDGADQVWTFLRPERSRG